MGQCTKPMSGTPALQCIQSLDISLTWENCTFPVQPQCVNTDPESDSTSACGQRAGKQG